MDDIKQLQASTKDFTVLYVEDDKDAREQIEGILGLLFKEVYVAQNGLEGIDVFKNHQQKIDLILTDVQMPVLDGLQMSKEIKEIDHSKHILILSAHNDIDYFSKAIDVGVDGFIIKPIVTEKFFQSILKATKLIKNQKIEEQYHEEIEKKLIERTEQLEKNIITDELTGLYNKTKLNIELSKKGEFTIVLVNIDNFDHINSTYGYDIGDKTLREIAVFLNDISLQNSSLFRLASDEIVYLVEDISRDAVGKFAEKINTEISKQTFMIDDIEIHVTCTIGITKGKGRQALADAHIAMKEIREIGKNRYHFYSAQSELQMRQKNNIEWFKKVKKALENDMIIPYFQPIVNNQNNKIEKYECLARIIEADRIITPYYFIDPARLVGMLPNITKVMIKKCFEVFSKREEEFSINITENDLKEGYLIEYLAEHIEKYAINPNRIVLEILENISAQGSKDALCQLKRIKELGIKLAMDDFGSEKSNFYRLQELNVNYIKIDGMFIKNLNTNKNSYQIAKTITQMAENLNAKVIAEYVCDEEVYKKVLELGIHYSQGYHFGKPEENIESPIKER